MICYKIKREQIKVEGRAYNTYSILCCDGKRQIIKIADAFATKDAAEQFVNICNELKLAPVHLQNVLDDYL